MVTFLIRFVANGQVMVIETTAKETTTPENNDLIGWMRKNNRAVHVQHAI